MVALTAQQVAACTGSTLLNVTRWVDPLNAAMAKWRVDTPARQAMFLAQVGVESTHLTEVEENLHYSAQRLLQVFPSHFKDLPDARAVALRGPQAIANRVYANRLGNGDEASGDGWRYRGMGLIQLTGKTEQLAYLKAAGKQFTSWLLTLEGATDSAGWFWQANGLNPHADAEDCLTCTRLVNGPDLLGAAERKSLFTNGLKELRA
jgi:putative chitinase